MRALVAIGLTISCAVALPARADSERVELSAPLFPNVITLYDNEGAHFPTTLAGEQQLAHDAAMTFDGLLADCATLVDPATHAFYDIVVPMPGDAPPSLDRVTLNFDQVAKCSYDQYTSKPYWIPQLIDDVGVCEAELGPDWHLPTEADVASFIDADFQFFHDTLTAAATGTSFWGSFYFSLTVYVRAGDNTIQKADLSPGITDRIIDLGLTGDQRKITLQQNVALRCLRRTAI